MIYFSTDFNMTSSSASFTCLVTIKLYDKYSFQSAVILLFYVLEKEATGKVAYFSRLLPHIISGASISPISCICTNAMLVLWSAVQRLKWLIMLQFCKDCCSLGSKVDTGTYRQHECPVRLLPFS
jgi:hypothetical protein